MDKLRINLIPPELKELAKKDAKRVLVSKISILLLGLLVLVTSVILSVVIYQSVSLGALKAAIDQERLKINSSKDKEAVLKLLKNRIDTINQFTGNRYKQGEIYTMMMKLFPPGIVLSSIQINKTPIVTITGETDDTLSLQDFFNNLTDPKTNEGKITSVKVESLSQSQKGGIRFDLKVNLAAGVNP
ncbi:MAG TPA: PilN domain-containing protein [Patescibacteria group bacterium]|nr:PilN domain-containing protein [Patescibacteria group bacterium]